VVPKSYLLYGAIVFFAVASAAMAGGSSARADASVPKALQAEPGNSGGAPVSDTSAAGREKTDELPYLEAALQSDPENIFLITRYIETLVRSGDYDKAGQTFALKIKNLSDFKAFCLRIFWRDMGNAFFAAGDYVQALQLYQDVFRLDPSDAEVLRGIISAACRTRDYMTAYKYLSFGREEKKIPGPVLKDLHVHLAEQMGSPVMALQFAEESGIGDRGRLDGLRADIRSEQLSWDEFEGVKAGLEQQLRADPRNVRAREEYIVALSRHYRMQEAWEQYRYLETQGRDSPFQVTMAVADALSHLKRPQEAERFYKKGLAQNPSEPFRAYLGLFNTYATLRKWDKADEIWKEIQALIDGNKLSWMEDHEALTARGWYLIAQDRLEEAQNFFEAALRNAALDSGFRSGLAHVYHFRGWPRKALEQFRIAESIDPEDISGRVGLAHTLSSLDRDREAGALASELYRTYPYDLHVMDLHDDLKIKGGSLVTGSARFIDESPGVTEYRLQLKGSTAINPSFTIFSEILHMHSREDGDGETFSFSWDRLGAGFSWIVTPGLTLTQAGSWDYADSADFGSTTKIAWNPNDHWMTAVGFESFSLDIPLRARVAGVQGKTALAEAAYHENELRDYNLALQSNWLNDGNFNPSLILGMEQTLIARPDWKLRAGPEFYYARYSKDQNDVPYYSPMYAYSLILKPVLQLTHYERYEKSFRSYIQADAGAFKQHDYGFYPVGGISYAQEIKSSKTFKMYWMAGYGARVYDGRHSHVLEVFLGISKYF